MKSKWFDLKPKAISLRKKGNSLRTIETKLGIPRSTLSGWFKTIKLTDNQYKVLREQHNEALVIARKRANVWHNQQKANRLQFAEIEAQKTLSNISDSTEIIELGLALLYLGEGFKKSPRTGMGNSDPLILKFFLRIITEIYKVDINKIRFDLHIRADQNPENIKKYWAEELEAPLDRFKNVFVDKRTMGKPTYPDYKGVCVIDCGNIAIQRKLVYIGRKFCEKILEKLGG